MLCIVCPVAIYNYFCLYVSLLFYSALIPILLINLMCFFLFYSTTMSLFFPNIFQFILYMYSQESTQKISIMAGLATFSFSKVRNSTSIYDLVFQSSLDRFLSPKTETKNPRVFIFEKFSIEKTEKTGIFLSFLILKVSENENSRVLVWGVRNGFTFVEDNQLC